MSRKSDTLYNWARRYPPTKSHFDALVEEANNQKLKEVELKKIIVDNKIAGHSDVPEEVRIKIVHLYSLENDVNSRPAIRRFILRYLEMMMQTFPEHTTIRQMESRIFDWNRKTHQSQYVQFQEEKLKENKKNNLYEFFEEEMDSPRRAKKLKMNIDNLNPEQAEIVKLMIKQFEKQGAQI